MSNYYYAQACIDNNNAYLVLSQITEITKLANSKYNKGTLRKQGN